MISIKFVIVLTLLFSLSLCVTMKLLIPHLFYMQIICNEYGALYNSSVI